MLRILLVIDDYGEMVYLQTLLKKIGFDVDSVQSQRTFSSKNLGFNPQIIIATADGRRVNGIEIAQNLRKRQGFPKILLIGPPTQLHELDAKNIKEVDGVLESPVNIQSLLEVIAKLGQIDHNSLLDKYSRMRAHLHPDEEGDLTLLKGDSSTGEISSPHPSHSSPEPTRSQMTAQERESRFKKQLDVLPTPTQFSFSRDVVALTNRELRRVENEDQLHPLEEERRGFVKALFKQKQFKK